MSNSYLGSRVSLISKSLIRYEGILYSIDAKESTIALSRVRFWGTENRAAEKFVPMRDEVYDYIIFRACDIRDLIVDPVQELPENEAFEDPAIVQAHLFSATGDNQSAAPTANNYPISAAPPSHVGNNKAFNGSNPALNNVAENVALFNGHPANSLPTGASASASAFEFHSRGSSPPSSHQRSPLPDQQQNGDSQSKPIENNVTDKVQAQKNQSNGGPRPWQNNHNNQTNQDRRSRGFQFNNQPQNRRAPGAFNPHHHHQGPNQFNRQQHYHGNNNGPNNNVMGYRRNQNGPISQNGLARPRNQQMAGRPLPPNMRPQFNDFKRVARKFDPALKTDYDFEKANQEFKELENKLGKLNVNVEWEGEQPPAPQAVDEEKTETEEAKSGDDECYDKKKSFFDKISCEAIERSKGKVNKVDWKQERKLNVETFGLQQNFRRNNYNGYRNNYGNRHNGGNRYRSNNQPHNNQNSSNNANSAPRVVNA